MAVPHGTGARAPVGRQTGIEPRMSSQAPLDRRDWIAGLEHGLKILEVFNDSLPRMTPSQAAARTGLTRTAARRHLRTLHHLGFVASDGKSFWLTPRVLRLGWSYFDSASLPRTIQPYLQRIAMTTDAAAYFSVLDGDEVVFVARNGTNRVQNVGFVLGARTLANLTSAGIAMLACQSNDEVEFWLSRQVFRPFTPFTMTSKDALRAAIERARALGYGLLEQQLELGVRGIAVALRDRHAEVVGALSVSLRIGTESADGAVARILPTLREAALMLMLQV